MGILLYNTWSDAVEVLTNSFETNKFILLKSYLSDTARTGVVENFYIDEDVENLQGYANIDFSLAYTEDLLQHGNFTSIKRNKDLRLLSSDGDIRWGVNLTNKIFNGDYPTGVCLDMRSGDVYFLDITISSTTLIYLGTLSESDFHLVSEMLDSRAPYSVDLNHEALIQVIEGSEGYNKLKSTLQIVFNCSGTLVPFAVQSSKGITE